MTTLSSDIINQAVAILRQGGLVAFPTETVYGLGADATNELAIRKIFQAKERPFDHPLIVHIASIEQLKNWARSIPPHAIKLAEIFWPGPLTMILPKQAGISDLITGGQDTIGLRIPRHPVAQQLLQAFNGGIAAPSANRFTHISPTTAEAVYEELNKRLDLILDGGPCEVGLESTIVDLSGVQPKILRPGMITAADIAAVIGPITLASEANETRVPGRHHLHYAPVTRTQVLPTQALPSLLQLAKHEFPIAIVARSELSDFSNTRSFHVVKMSTQAAAYAHDLYQILRSLDHQQFKRIVIEAVPENPEWEAIRDRIMKASAR